MASIATTIQLYDRCSQPLNMIVSALHTTVNAFAAMNSAMSAGMDTSGFDDARQAIDQAVSEVNALQQAIQEVNSEAVNLNVDEIAAPDIHPVTVPVEPDVPSPLVETPEPVTVPVEWESADIDVFTNTGIERFEQELNAANNMMQDLVQTQDQIQQNASRTNILPPKAQADIQRLTGRIQAIQQRVQALNRTPVSLRTDEVNNELEEMRSQLAQAVDAQNELNRAIDQMDVSAANDAYNRLSQTVGNTERYIRDNTNSQGQFNQSIEQGTNNANNLLRTIGQAVAAYASIATVKKLMDMSDELTQTTARLNIMNQSFQEAQKGAYDTQETINLIYASAQNARSEFGAMADVVARFGNNAGDAFSSTQEVVDFANLVQKQMTIAGAGTQEASNAILQLSQALGSGVLRGDELNSIFEQAPNLIQSIADYLGVPIGKIREMAQEGQLSADIVKNAVFSAADEINANFENMPMTWNQVWTAMGNTALMQMQPVLAKVNELANNAQFQVMIQNLMNAFGQLAITILNIMEMAGQAAAFISDNWSTIEPIVMGIVTAMGLYIAALTIYNAIQGISAVITGVKAAAEMMASGATFMATAAQTGFNAALLACPITWIVIAIIAAIAAIVAFAQHIAETGEIATTAFGVICGWINVVIQFFVNLGLEVANIALGIWNALGALASNMVTAFQNSIANIQTFFYNLLSTALSVISQIAAALSKLPFVEFDASGLAAAADNYASKAAAAQASKGDYESMGAAFAKGAGTYDAFGKGWASDAYKSGANFGDGISNKVSNFFHGNQAASNVDTSTMFNGGGYTPGNYTGLPASGVGSAGDLGKAANNTAANTAAAAGSLSTSGEDLKYLRDIAEREVVNRFTTAKISIKQNNNNNINSGLDVDGLMNGMVEGLQEAISKTTEGVHF